MCPCCLGPRCPCIQIDAADLIKPVGLHVECQHCHQAQWEPNGGIGRIDPVDSIASAQSHNQRPLRSKAMILSRDPLPGGKGRWRRARQRQRVGWGEGWAQEEGGCDTLKYQRDPGSDWKCWRSKLLSGRVGSILRPFGSFSGPSWEEMRGLCSLFSFCHKEKSETQIILLGHLIM